MSKLDKGWPAKDRCGHNVGLALGETSGQARQ